MTHKSIDHTNSVAKPAILMVNINLKIINWYPWVITPENIPISDQTWSSFRMCAVLGMLRESLTDFVELIGPRRTSRAGWFAAEVSRY
jgi:hypothetical protein